MKRLELNVQLVFIEKNKPEDISLAKTMTLTTSGLCDFKILGNICKCDWSNFKVDYKDDNIYVFEVTCVILKYTVSR